MEDRKDQSNDKDKQINIRFRDDTLIYYKFAMCKPNTNYYIIDLIKRDMESDDTNEQS